MPRISRPRADEPVRLVHNKNGVRYRAVVNTGHHPDGRRRQETKTLGTLTAARQWVEDTRTDVRHNTYTPPARTTVDQLADMWLASRHDVRPITVNGYRSALLSARSRLGSRPVQEVRPSDLVAFVKWLDKEGGRNGTGVSHRTIVLTLGAMKQMFRWAVAEGLVWRSPAEVVKAPRQRAQDDREVVVWTAEELAAFVAHTDSEADVWVRVGFRLSACGLRRSEVCGLRWQDVNLDEGTVLVSQSRVAYRGIVDTDKPKSTASRRLIPVEVMRPGITALLREAYMRAEDKDGLLLVDALGRPVHPDIYSDRFKALRKAAEVPAIRLHDVRHSVSTRLAEKGLSAEARAQLLGHSKIVNQTTYTVATAETMNAAAEAYAAVFAPAQ